MPSEAGHTICQQKNDTNVFYLGNETWKVGPRYKLLHYLGAGSFSTVCAALDTETNTVVALKKMSDVGSSLENARKVLREVCIQRRLSHPHIVALHDVFWKPSPTGTFRYVNGCFVSSSLDVYLALEYCAAGDLHALKGQLTQGHICALLSQITAAVQYLHSLNVWHRDLKSANILLKVAAGQQVVKVADLGSARSATMPPAVQFDSSSQEQQVASTRSLDRSESMISMPAGVSMLPHSEQQRIATDSKAGLLTHAVCTPCYRAPEVVISRGRYSAAMDMWSLGCIFGELLQRMERSGASFTPKLTIDPVFKLSPWSPMTPSPSSTFQADESLASRELKAIFDVIGTPEWACIDAVDNSSWRHFLSHLPARAPHLMRRFWFAGEPAIDLLRRLLAFDPSRRCSADEAMTHEYFTQRLGAGEDDEEKAGAEREAEVGVIQEDGKDGAMDTGGGGADEPVEARVAARGEKRKGGRGPALRLTQEAPGVGVVRERRAVKRQKSPGEGFTVDAQEGEQEQEEAGGCPMECDLSKTNSAATEGDAPELQQQGCKNRERYYDIAEPAEALRALEEELERLLVEREAEMAGPQARKAACEALCLLIKRECDAEAELQSEARAARAVHGQLPQEDESSVCAEFQRRWWGRENPLEPDPLAPSTCVDDRTTSRTSSPDDVLLTTGQGITGFVPASARLPTSPAASRSVCGGKLETALRAEELLKPGRHEEWSVHSGRELTAPEGPAWGGGMGQLGMDDATQQIVGRQQYR